MARSTARTIPDDEYMRLGVSMIVQWLFGPVGLQVADYVGTIAVGVNTP